MSAAGEGRAGEGRGAGKVILVGEHAVVYGHPALAAALDRHVVARATPVLPGRPARLVVPAWGIDLAVPSGNGGADDPAAAPARALRALGEALGVDATAYDLTALADVPARAGLGSSAAFAVAAARALAAAAGLAVDDATIERVAGAAENVFHGRASGVDVALATRGGLGLYTREAGLAPLGDVAAFELVIGLSGEPRDTLARVADVARQRAATPAATDAQLGALGELARGAAACLRAGDLAPLGQILDEAQTHLAALALSTPRLDTLVAAARAAGALGAKLTGAGGGGAMIALPRPGHAPAVIRALEALGAPAHVVNLCSRGLPA